MFDKIKNLFFIFIATIAIFYASTQTIFASSVSPTSVQLDTVMTSDIGVGDFWAVFYNDTYLTGLDSSNFPDTWENNVGGSYGVYTFLLTAEDSDCQSETVAECKALPAYLGSEVLVTYSASVTAQSFVDFGGTDVLFAGVGSATTNILGSLWGFTYFVMGLLVAWFVIESLILIFGDTMKRNEKLEGKNKQ